MQRDEELAAGRRAAREGDRHGVEIRARRVFRDIHRRQGIARADGGKVVPSSQGVRPPTIAANTNNVVFTFRRSDSSETDVTLKSAVSASAKAMR